MEVIERRVVLTEVNVMCVIEFGDGQSIVMCGTIVDNVLADHNVTPSFGMVKDFEALSPETQKELKNLARKEFRKWYIN